MPARLLPNLIMQQALHVQQLVGWQPTGLSAAGAVVQTSVPAMPEHCLVPGTHSCQQINLPLVLPGAEAASSQLVQVVICSRKQKNVDDTLKTLRGEGIDCQGCACHVGSRDHLKKLVKLAVDSYGRIDVLVSNAAVNPMSGAGPTLPVHGSAPVCTFPSSTQGQLRCLASVLLDQAQSFEWEAPFPNACAAHSAQLVLVMLDPLK